MEIEAHTGIITDEANESSVENLSEDPMKNTSSILSATLS